MLNKFLLFAFMLLMSCSTTTKSDKEYADEINEWHKKRIDGLKEKDSWLSLAGLYWLKEGKNTFGSDKSNDIKFPQNKSEKFMGWFNLENGQVSVHINENVEITIDNKPEKSSLLKTDISGKPTILKYNSLSWYAIKRQEKIGIRLKDSENPEFERFTGIDRFDVEAGWKVPAEFIPYEPVKTIEIPTILGTVEKDTCPGKLQFNIDDETFQLDPTGSIKSKKLFLIFADKTNGEDTYGAGRFLSIDIPNPDSTVYIDFNKAYNPPCAFTKFATCPLPPKQNYLPIEVTAGEKNYAHALH